MVSCFKVSHRTTDSRGPCTHLHLHMHQVFGNFGGDSVVHFHLDTPMTIELSTCDAEAATDLCVSAFLLHRLLS
jgi:hypothetical protein